ASFHPHSFRGFLSREWNGPGLARARWWTRVVSRPFGQQPRRNGFFLGLPSHGAASSSPNEVLTRNTKLDSTLTTKLQSKNLLPAGTDLISACSEFRN